jgi:bacterioferritin-associated ferredoxin
MYICICHAVTEQQIRDAVREGAATVGELGARLGVSSGCGCCRSLAKEVVDQTLRLAGLPENRAAA